MRSDASCALALLCKASPRARDVGRQKISEVTDGATAPPHGLHWPIARLRMQRPCRSLPLHRRFTPSCLNALREVPSTQPCVSPRLCRRRYPTSALDGTALLAAGFLGRQRMSMRNGRASTDRTCTDVDGIDRHRLAQPRQTRTTGAARTIGNEVKLVAKVIVYSPVSTRRAVNPPRTSAQAHPPRPRGCPRSPKLGHVSRMRPSSVGGDRCVGELEEDRPGLGAVTALSASSAAPTALAAMFPCTRQAPRSCMFCTLRQKSRGSAASRKCSAGE